MQRGELELHVPKFGLSIPIGFEDAEPERYLVAHHRMIARVLGWNVIAFKTDNHDVCRLYKKRRALLESV